MFYFTGGPGSRKRDPRLGASEVTTTAEAIGIINYRVAVQSHVNHTDEDVQAALSVDITVQRIQAITPANAAPGLHNQGRIYKFGAPRPTDQKAPPPEDSDYTDVEIQ
ncbi:hypothetical protein J6590_056486 [Homalodisca vitripennis]|nr:hypothetical protein J6590_056486 [Homalodisca vitripennis]